ncbi:hypothetical protein [Eleftheria terrae]|uniref:hypothetical protein n=1 Tax=Eleftheria terrae TaxID=1597781 RepID=UPI00263BBAC8|nr:hypothetical protein [Eleftheria terrae]WKB53849.1 hypothetical protein N7L95_05540 [Eleftheria terrae]
MLNNPEITQVADDGLRYHSKAGGSPFRGMGQLRSCFLCGRHRSAAALMSRRLLGRVEKVCQPRCGTAG